MQHLACETVVAPFVAQVSVKGEWQSIDLNTALGLHRNRVMRCIECQGRVRAFRQGSNGQVAHMEHDHRNKGCSRGDCFDGEHRIHHRPVR